MEMGVDDPQLKMETTTVKKRLLQEIENSSEELLEDVLDFLLMTIIFTEPLKRSYEGCICRHILLDCIVEPQG